jgi:hypothetical protein
MPRCCYSSEVGFQRIPLTIVKQNAANLGPVPSANIRFGLVADHHAKRRGRDTKQLSFALHTWQQYERKLRL